jgi:hypothetical protein
VNPLDGLLYVTRWLAQGALSPLASWPPALSLALIAVLAALGMLWTVRRYSDQEAIREVKRRLRAHLYELRLFADEPALIWRAQWQLLRFNLRYLRLMLRPALVLALPMALLLIHLDAFYGRTPLAVGKAAVVTIKLTGSASVPALEAPAGIAVETPGVRLESEREVSWRLRPLREASGRLRFVFPEAAAEKQIEAGEQPRYLSARRVSSLGDSLLNPAEPRLSGIGVEWIEIRYPPAAVPFCGVQFHWLVWFLVVSLVAAWVLKGRLGMAL